MSFHQYHTPVLANYRLAKNTYLIRLHAPALAAAIRPGQFVMVRLPNRTDPLLGRPFALYDTHVDEHGTPIGIDIVYLVVGKVTGLLSGLQKDDAVEVWGPLGNGFPEPVTTDHVGLVAGGIGQTPFLAHTRELLGNRVYGQTPRKPVQRVSLYYGVRTKDFAAGVDDFQKAAQQYISPPTTAPSAITASSPISWPSTNRRSISSAAAPNRCCTPSPSKQSNAASRAISR